jgi:hypothetical protein
VRLQRQWGVQARTIAGDWGDPAWIVATDSRDRAHAAVDALYPKGEARVVTRVASPWEPVETPA